MLKSIKVKQEVYEALDKVAEKRESYGDTIMRLIKAYNELTDITYSRMPKVKS